MICVSSRYRHWSNSSNHVGWNAIMGMQQKLVDGIDFPQSCLNAFKLDEMLRFFSFTQHTFSPVALCYGYGKI